MTWIIAKLASVVGVRFARPVAIGLIAVALMIIGGILFTQCGSDNEAEQARQTTRSSEAVADAAKAAIETLEGRTATEDAIDQAVEETVSQVEDARDIPAIHAAVRAGLCGRVEYRNDPACQTGEE